MAYVIFTDNKTKSLTNEQGLLLWQVLQGQIEPTPQQEKWALRTKRLFLDVYTAPQDYIDKYRALCSQAVLKDYMCDRDGKLTRVDLRRPQAQSFVRRNAVIMAEAKRLHPNG